MLVDVTLPFTQCLARCCCRNGQAMHPQSPLRNTTQLLTPATSPPNPYKCLLSLLSQCSRESLLLLHHDVAAGTVRSSIIFTFITLNPLHFHQRHRSWRRGRSARSLYVNAVFTSRAHMSRLHWHQHWHSTRHHATSGTGASIAIMTRIVRIVAGDASAVVTKNFRQVFKFKALLGPSAS